MSIRSILYGAFACASIVHGQTTGPNGYPLMSGGTGAVGNATVAGNGSSPVDGKYVISAAGIRMAFIPYGASASNLFINDTMVGLLYTSGAANPTKTAQGVERDVILGFDNATAYTNDRLHPYLGPVPGQSERGLGLVSKLTLKRTICESYREFHLLRRRQDLSYPSEREQR